MDDGRPHVVVIGGGITGLAVAWFIHDRARVTVLEADGRLGGKIRTSSLAGVPVEEGPDTFLARIPHAGALATDLGLGGDMVQPATSEAFVWTRGHLRPLPEGHVLGVPVELRSLLRSRVLSPRGVARCGFDLLLPRSRPRLSTDPSLTEVIGARMGQEVVDRLVEPLIGGINAGRADDLSLASTAPPIAAVATRSRSLVVGMRRDRDRRAKTTEPVFLGIAGGMSRLVERLGVELARSGVAVVTDADVKAIEPAGPGSGYRVATATGPMDAAGVVVAVPARAASLLVRETSPAAAEDLDRIRYASVAVATMAYRPADVRSPLSGAGFLVPRVERRLMSACTWSTSKWPGLASSGLVMLRASTGRSGDDRHADLDDPDLVDRLHHELSEAIDLRGAPVTSLVSRWPNGFPQYQPGHSRRVERIDTALGTAMPGVLVAGAAYRGLGVSSCIRDAEVAAGKLADVLWPAAG